MKSRTLIEQEADRTLDSLDGVERAHANPFLFKRIMARLKKEEKNLWVNALTFLSRPTVAFAMILVAIFLNAVLYFESRSEALQSAGEADQVFANEYNLTDNTIYDSNSERE